MTAKTVNKASLKTAKITGLLAVGMFGFGFALVPIYNSVCQWLGINGQTTPLKQQAAAALVVDSSRTVTVEFHSDVHSALNWQFGPEKRAVQVHPGEQKRVHYSASNQAAFDVVGIAKFNIHPPEAGKYFKKTECFCFIQQTLKKGETRKMPILFVVDPALPKRITHITLTYKFLKDDTVAKK